MTDSSWLDELNDEQRTFWNNASFRRDIINAIADALAKNAESEALIHLVDESVSAGLAALRLRRGPIRALRIEHHWPGWRGRKRPDCLLLISGDDIREAVRRGQPDSVIRTWIHESLHARQPFSATARTEYESFQGYEEGMVEALTRLVLERADIDVRVAAFEYYVGVYQALAAELGIDHEHLCRQIWRLAPGQVRMGIVPIVEALVSFDHSGISPRFLSIADQLMSSTRRNTEPDLRILRATWKLALS